MGSRRLLHSQIAVLVAAGAFCNQALAQASPPTSSSRSKQVRASAPASDFPLDAGVFGDGIYRNPSFGFTCKIPAGWVLRTGEMNARDEVDSEDAGRLDPQKNSSSKKKPGAKNMGKIDGRVLLAAFSRPPEAKGEDVNSSILIAAESVAAYPGLKQAAQYFGPVAEVAKGQGFALLNEPYEFTVGTKTVVQGDFQKSVGSRVMRQSTLVILAHSYVVSLTFIAGTEEELKNLITGLSFALNRNSPK